MQCKPGKGNYILYHGNLSVSENYNAALWLIENVFSKITQYQFHGCYVYTHMAPRSIIFFFYLNVYALMHS